MQPPVHKSWNQLEEDNCRLKQSLANAKGYLAAFAEREEILEVQMVVQDMALVKLKGALHSKEMKKAERKDNEMLLNDGKGRLWSDARILEYQQMKREEKAQEEAEKEQRKQQKSSKKALKSLIDAEWATIK